MLNFNDPILVLQRLLAMGNKCGLESKMTFENVAIEMKHLFKPVKLIMWSNLINNLIKAAKQYLAATLVQFVNPSNLSLKEKKNFNYNAI